MATPQQLLPTIILVASLLIILAVVLFLWSLRQFRMSRTDSYWRRRRTAGQRGLKALVWSITVGTLGGILWVAIGLSFLIYFRPALSAGATKAAGLGSPTIVIPTNTPQTAQAPTAPEATSTPLETPTLVPSPMPTSPTPSPTITATLTMTFSQTPLPPTQTTVRPTVPPTNTATETPVVRASTTASPTPTVTPSQTQAAPVLTTQSPPTPGPTTAASATASPTVLPTLTPGATDSPTLKPVIISSLTLESSVTPSRNAALKITALDTQISGNFEPITPSDTFTQGFTRIYFFVTFSGMQPGILWRRELVMNGKVIEAHAYLWGLEQEGDAYFFFGQEDGFKPGQYAIRLYLGKLAEPIAVKTFVVN